MTAPLGPVMVRVTRYACPHCSRSRSKKTATAAHIGRCWQNPAVRACKTCVHFDPGGDACGCTSGCNWGSAGPDMPSCAAGLPLPTDFMPVTNCPEWSPR